MRNIRLLPANAPRERELEEALSAVSARVVAALPLADGRQMTKDIV
jgi:hypothetical protein